MAGHKAFFYHLSARKWYGRNTPGSVVVVVRGGFHDATHFTGPNPYADAKLFMASLRRQGAEELKGTKSRSAKPNPAQPIRLSEASAKSKQASLMSDAALRAALDSASAQAKDWRSRGNTFMEDKWSRLYEVYNREYKARRAGKQNPAQARIKMARYDLNLKPETALERAVAKWLREAAKDREGSITSVYGDLQNGGCASGMVGDLIYYIDTIPFYKKHRKDIDALLKELVDDTGEQPSKLFSRAGWDDEDYFARETTNQNILAWFGFEEAARWLVERAGYEG